MRGYRAILSFLAVAAVLSGCSPTTSGTPSPPTLPPTATPTEHKPVSQADSTPSSTTRPTQTPTRPSPSPSSTAANSPTPIPLMDPPDVYDLVGYEIPPLPPGLPFLFVQSLIQGEMPGHIVNYCLFVFDLPPEYTVLLLSTPQLDQDQTPWRSYDLVTDVMLLPRLAEDQFVFAFSCTRTDGKNSWGTIAVGPRPELYQGGNVDRAWRISRSDGTFYPISTRNVECFNMSDLYSFEYAPSP
jgi:hypothetical protein